MSFDALAWAAKCKVAKSTDKLVLLGLAECASRDTCLAWPSIDALVEFGSLNRKTVITALDRLEGAGFITATGDCTGRTKQIKVYRLNLETVPKTEPSQKRNSTAFTPKQSQKRDTDTVKEPVIKQTQREHVMPDGWGPVAFGPKTKSRETVDGWPPGELDSQFEHFAAHHRSKGSKFVDWQDAWSTWVLKSRQFGGRNANDRKSSPNANRGRNGFLNACYEAADGQAGHPFAGNG